MKRKNGEGSWGTKTIKGTVYQYYRQDNNYTYGRTIKEVKEKLKNKSSCKSAASKIHTLKNYGMNWLRTVKALELEARTYDEWSTAFRISHCVKFSNTVPLGRIIRSIVWTFSMPPFWQLRMGSQ